MLIFLTYSSVFLVVASCSYLVMSTIPDKDRLKEEKLNIWVKLDRLVKQKGIVKRVNLEIQQANLKIRFSEYVGIHIFSLLVGAILSFGIWHSWIVGLGFALVIGCTPWLWLKYLQKRRMAKMNAQLPDVLILMSNALKAGYSFMQGVDEVAKDALPPISEEFARVAKEINLGYPVKRSLDDLCERVASDDLDLAITVIKIQRQTGGNLSEILDKIVYTIGERIKIKGEISTMTAQGKFQGWLLVSLPPCLVWTLNSVNPGFISPMIGQPMGQLLITAAIIFQIIGALLILKIVNIKI